MTPTFDDILIGGLATAFSTKDERIAELEARVAELESGLSEMAEDMRLGDIDYSIAMQAVYVMGSRDYLHEAKGAITTAYEAEVERASELEGRLNDSFGEIEDYEQEVCELSNEVTSLEQEINTLALELQECRDEAD